MKPSGCRATRLGWVWLAPLVWFTLALLLLATSICSIFYYIADVARANEVRDSYVPTDCAVLRLERTVRGGCAPVHGLSVVLVYNTSQMTSLQTPPYAVCESSSSDDVDRCEQDFETGSLHSCHYSSMRDRAVANMSQVQTYARHVGQFVMAWALVTLVLSICCFLLGWRAVIVRHVNGPYGHGFLPTSSLPLPFANNNLRRRREMDPITIYVPSPRSDKSRSSSVTSTPRSRPNKDTPRPPLPLTPTAVEKARAHFDAVGDVPVMEIPL